MQQHIFQLVIELDELQNTTPLAPSCHCSSVQHWENSMLRGPLHEKRLKLPVGERPPKPLEWAEGEEAQPQHASGNVRLTSRNGKNRTLRPFQPIFLEQPDNIRLFLSLLRHLPINTRRSSSRAGSPRSQMSSIVPQSADGGSNLSGKRKTADGTVWTANRAGRR